MSFEVEPTRPKTYIVHILWKKVFKFNLISVGCFQESTYMEGAWDLKLVKYPSITYLRDHTILFLFFLKAEKTPLKDS